MKVIQTNGQPALPLRLWRKMHAMRQSDLAERLGVSRVTVSNWERGTVPQVARLALQTIERSLASPEKTRAEESGKI